MNITLGFRNEYKYNSKYNDVMSVLLTINNICISSVSLVEHFSFMIVRHYI